MNAASLLVAYAHRFKKQVKTGFAYLLILIVSFPLASAHARELTLINGDDTRHIATASLIPQADTTFTLFDPYQGREVEMRGFEFRDFLIEQFGDIPPALHFTAWDDYDVTLSGWDDPNWFMIVEEDGEPLTLRSRGPLRLVERDYGARDINSLREFNDWVWMIRSIEARW
nr:hypothetical protein [Halomonas sp.]